MYAYFTFFCFYMFDLSSVDFFNSAFMILCCLVGVINDDRILHDYINPVTGSFVVTMITLPGVTTEVTDYSLRVSGRN